jgi:hypothetical protein
VVDAGVEDEGTHLKHTLLDHFVLAAANQSHAEKQR